MGDAPLPKDEPTEAGDVVPLLEAFAPAVERVDAGGRVGDDVEPPRLARLWPSAELVPGNDHVATPTGVGVVQADVAVMEGDGKAITQVTTRQFLESADVSCFAAVVDVVMNRPVAAILRVDE